MENNSIIVIKTYNPDSMNSVSHFAALAVNEEAAKRWIQDEVDDLHGVHGYMKGKSADWWIENRYFSLHPTKIHS